MFDSPDGPVYSFEEVVDNFFGGISFLDGLVDLISEQFFVEFFHGEIAGYFDVLFCVEFYDGDSVFWFDEFGEQVVVLVYEELSMEFLLAVVVNQASLAVEEQDVLSLQTF